MNWLGSLLIRETTSFESPWHAEKLLVGEKITIDLTKVGGPHGICEITGRRPLGRGDRVELTVVPIEIAREYPLA